MMYKKDMVRSLSSSVLGTQLHGTQVRYRMYRMVGYIGTVPYGMVYRYRMVWYRYPSYIQLSEQDPTGPKQLRFFRIILVSKFREVDGLNF